MKRRRSNRRAAFETFYFVGTTVATAAVLYAMLPVWLGGAFLGMHLIHEMGHYAVLAHFDQKPWLPFFIPLFFIVRGTTAYEGEDPEHLRKAALAGPLAGLVFALAMAAFCLWMGFIDGAFAAGWLALYNVYAALLGSDGRDYRRYTRAWREASVPEEDLVSAPAFA